jgi:inosine-uridine nucleoside N-ribohydrolase
MEPLNDDFGDLFEAIDSGDAKQIETVLRAMTATAEEISEFIHICIEAEETQMLGIMLDYCASKGLTEVRSDPRRLTWLYHALDIELGAWSQGRVPVDFRVVGLFLDRGYDPLVPDTSQREGRNCIEKVAHYGSQEGLDLFKARGYAVRNEGPQ